MTGVANGPSCPWSPPACRCCHQSRRTSTAGSARAEQGSPSCARCRRSATPQATRSASGSQALPTLDAVAQKVNSLSDNVTRLGFRFDHKSIGLELNVPLFAGGYVSSKVRRGDCRPRAGGAVDGSHAARAGAACTRNSAEWSKACCARPRWSRRSVRRGGAAIHPPLLQGRLAHRRRCAERGGGRVSALPDWRTRAMPTCLRASLCAPWPGEANAATIAETNAWLQPAKATVIAGACPSGARPKENDIGRKSTCKQARAVPGLSPFSGAAATRAERSFRHDDTGPDRRLAAAGARRAGGAD